MQVLKSSFILAIILVLTLMTYPVMAGGHGAKGGPPKPIVPGGDTVNISGIVLDSHKEAVDEAEVLLKKLRTPIQYRRADILGDLSMILHELYKTVMKLK